MVRLTEKQLNDKISFINSYTEASNAATGSAVDANANVSCKNIATLSAEINKDINVQINRRMLKDRISAMFGSSLGDEYIRQLEAHEIYCHDESSLQPYCVSVSLYPFLLEGLKPVGGESTAPKNLNSFCGAYVNLIFALSSQFAGAVGAAETITAFDFFARKQFGENYLETNSKDIEQWLQSIIYAINQPASARNYQSVFLNWSIFDKYYFESLFGDFVFPDGTKPVYESVAKLQSFFMHWFNAERKKALLTFPVVTAAMLYENDKPRDDEFYNMISKELSEGNSFFIYTSDKADSLSSCCRLKSEFSENVFSSTLGAGGVATGSINVITINLNSLVQENRDLLTELDKVHKYQIAYKAITEDFYNSGMLPVYSAGFISIKKQFLTIGLNGIVEAAEFKGIKVGNNKEYKEFLISILKPIYERNKEASVKYGQRFNTEFVPAENLGVKNAIWDKKKGLRVPRDCYNSYFYKVEDDTVNVVDKFILHGREVIQYLDGGSALHLNLEEHPTQDGYKNLILLAIKTGCNYFTTNVKVTCCEDCGNIDKRTLKQCPKCASSNITYATRIIGYLKKISSFAEARQIEESKRLYHKGV